MDCQTCAFFVYDEDYEEEVCTADMDQDDMGRLMTGEIKACPFYRNGDEYEVVKHQM